MRVPYKKLAQQQDAEGFARKTSDVAPESTRKTSDAAATAPRKTSDVNQAAGKKLAGAKDSKQAVDAKANKPAAAQ